MRKILITWGLWVFCLGTAFGGTPPQDHYVILLSIDGLRADALSLNPKDIPHFHRLLNEGAGTLSARSDPSATVTLPNHTSILTGLPVGGPLGHHYTENGGDQRSVHQAAGRYLRSIFDAAHDRGLRTGFFGSKKKFEVFVRSYGAGAAKGNKLDTAFISKTDDLETLRAFLEVMGREPPRLTFLHLAGPDRVGHAKSWTLEKGSSYREEVLRQDRHVGRILDMIDRSPRLSGRTTLILTADHGGATGARNHLSADEPLNFTIPFIVWGNGVKPDSDLYGLNQKWRSRPDMKEKHAHDGKEPIRNADAANLALSLLGLDPLPEAAGFEHPLRVNKDQH